MKNNEQPLTVLHLQPYLNLTCGISRMIFHLMMNAGDDDTHFVGTFNGDALIKFKKFKLPVVRFFMGKNPALALIHIWQMYKFCRQKGVQVIHAHHRYFDLTGRIVASLLKIPLLTSVHSKVDTLRAISYKADRFVVPSDAVKRHLISTFSIPANKITVIHNFVTPEVYEVPGELELISLKKKYKIPDNRTILLFVGRLSKEKGIDLLMRAARRLMREFSDICLLIIGTGPEEKQTKKFIEDNLFDTIVIEPQEKVTPFYVMSDIVILPSRVDPYPLVVLEAGLMKKPVVAANVDGIPEMITHGETGILFERESVTGMVDAIRCLLDDASLQVKLATHLQEQVLQNSLHTHKVPEYTALYRECIAANGALKK